ncbi:unnamed protein product [Paramecium primaurelia]|uniref:Uncharacterized protein n=1 Tax=Paramecium primaurelia TaxID=5886 RepID=A0A8S1KDX9_PARPR|nr:unnamed protein product [Paramecium primaurelia]
MNEGKLMGGGLFDEESKGIKIGYWMELSDGQDKRSQVIHVEYRYGKKFGNGYILEYNTLSQKIINNQNQNKIYVSIYNCHS